MATPTRLRPQGAPLTSDAGDLALRRLLLIPHMPVAAEGDGVASPIINTMRALSPMRRGTPLRRSDADGSGTPVDFRGRPVHDYGPSIRPPGVALSTLLGRKDSPKRSAAASGSSGAMLGFMGPPSLQLSKGVASSISAYQPALTQPASASQLARQLEYSLVGGASSGVSHYNFLTGKDSADPSADERPPTPVTPSMLRAAMGAGEGSSAPIAHRYLIGKEGEQALREAPIVYASIAKAKANAANCTTATQKFLVQRGPDDWFMRRAEHIKIRFRISAPQLLMYPLLFPTVDGATTYFPNASPMISLGQLVCKMTADDLIQLTATAVREQLISPAVVAAGGDGASSRGSIHYSLTGPSGRLGPMGGPSALAMEEQVMQPFRPLMECFTHERACSSIAVAWPLERPEYSALGASLHGESQTGAGGVRSSHAFPTSATHTFLYLQGPHLMSTFPLISAWSRSMLLNKDRSSTTMIDIFAIARGGSDGPR